MILAFDTSSAMTSVALADHTGVLVARSELDARRHAEVLAPLLAETIRGVDVAQIDAVACGVGPGPYTGLRVGIATALAVGAAWHVPVYGICSLDAIAAAVVRAGDGGDGFCVGTDARRREIYWARYSSNANRLDGPRVSAPDDIDANVRAGVWVGHGASASAWSFGRVVPESDPPSSDGYAQAAWVALIVRELLASGAATREADPLLDRHGQDSGATSLALKGAALLPPRPLYLRRPDAVEVGVRS